MLLNEYLNPFLSEQKAISVGTKNSKQLTEPHETEKLLYTKGHSHMNKATRYRME